MTCNPAQRGRKIYTVSGSHLYVHFYLYKMFHVEHCTYILCNSDL